MKKEYDFSKGEQGKFYRRGARLNLPVYLEDGVQRQVARIADKKGCDVSDVVNDLLRTDVRLSNAQ